MNILFLFKVFCWKNIANNESLKVSEKQVSKNRYSIAEFSFVLLHR
jgi:hypothetical protein